jgi:hypothetical protein
MDSQISLQQPILDGGIRSINFFNGRLLSARDLTREQSANREAERRLGQAIGEGVAYGLEVSKSNSSTQESPVVTVEAGLAINRTGQTLMLAAKTDVALVRRAAPGSGNVEFFGECAPLQSGTYVAGAGVYLLTIAPAQGTEGRAATHSLESTNASCNTDTTVNAVQFRLVQLDQQISAAEMLNQNKLRNLIAYKCFGVDSTSQFPVAPFTTNLEKYGLLDSLRPTWLTECEVPLAILYWTLVDGIKFVDLWSVRRQLFPRSADKTWPFLTTSRRRTEAVSMFLEFAEQLDAMRENLPNPAAVRAVDHFRYLPPVGIVPLSTGQFQQGFHKDLFFDTITRHPEVHIEGARIEALMHAALHYPPVDLDSHVMIWVYRVRENQQQQVPGANTGGSQPYLIFTTGHMAYLGDAHFDVNRWDFSNFA